MPIQNWYFPGILISLGGSMTRNEELVRLSQNGAPVKSNKAPSQALKWLSTESYSNRVMVWLWPATLFKARSSIFGWQSPLVGKHVPMVASNLFTMLRKKKLAMLVSSGALCYTSSRMHWSSGVLMILRLPLRSFRKGKALGFTNCKALAS